MVGRTLLRQARGDFSPVNRMYPVEVLGDWPRFIRLDRPDEMPFDAGRGLSGTRFNLGKGFLQVVFAEGVLAQRGKFEHARSVPGFAHRKQRHRLRRAIDRCTG